MKTSELIAALQASLATDGDRLVCVDDADTTWHMPVTAVTVDPSGRLLIETEGYGGEYFND